MKIWLPIIILLLSVTGLCLWDGIHTTKAFDALQNEGTAIYEEVVATGIENENLKQRIYNFNDFWTKKMDTLSVSISRKDLQPVSDYIQYLYAAAINENQEEAVTYSRLIHYNLIGLRECYGINWINLL